jgi:putative membrane protein
MTDAAPRRVHPFTILTGAVRSAPSTLLGIPAVIALGSRSNLLIVLAIALGVLGVMGLVAWLKWRHFTYAIQDGALVIEQGLLQTSRRSIPLERVQDVSFEQKPLQRIFGIALVRVETGGGDKDEAVLDSVAMAEALRLREVLRTGGVAAAAAEDAAPAAEPERVVFAMSLGRVLLFGLFGFSLLWLAAIYGVFQTLDQAIDFDWEQVAGVAQEQVRSHWTIGAGLVVAGLALLLGVIAGTARTLARDYGFRLSDHGARFRRVRGLLTRSEVVVVKDRIQLGLIRRPMVRGRLGWWALEVQTLGGSDDVSGRQELAPFARAGEVAAVVGAAGLPAFERQGLNPVAAGHVARAALRHGVPLAVLFGVAGIFFAPAWLGLASVPVAVGVALLQRRHHRYALRDGSLQVTRGVLTGRDWILPYDAVQSVTVRQTLLQRLLGVASVQPDSAGASGVHRPEVADVRVADARVLAAALVARSEGA